MQRLHATNVTTIVYDWLKDTRGPKENKKYDRILVDVPCSNTGVIRRRIDVKLRLKPEDFAAHAEVQLKLLLSCVHSLASGGVLVYSTCSIDKEENEDVVAKAIKAIPGLSLIETRQTLPQRDGVDGAFAAALRLDHVLPPITVSRATSAALEPVAEVVDRNEAEDELADEDEEEFDDLDDEFEDDNDSAAEPVKDEAPAPNSEPVTVETKIAAEDEVVFLAEDEESAPPGA
jgi:hypothetical protein